jgi:hypothetical protein
LVPYFALFLEKELNYVWTQQYRTCAFLTETLLKEHFVLQNSVKRNNTYLQKSVNLVMKKVTGKKMAAKKWRLQTCSREHHKN